MNRNIWQIATEGWKLWYIQCDQNWIVRSGPWVLDCYNGKIQSYFAKSGPFPDHFLHFPGLLVVMFIQILKRIVKYKMVENCREFS